jgi:cell wall-associated NlpC family hydrolase
MPNTLQDAMIRRQRIRMTPGYTERLNPIDPNQPQQPSPDDMLAQLAQQQQEQNARFQARPSAPTTDLKAGNPMEQFAQNLQFEKGSLMAPYQRQMQRQNDITESSNMFAQLQAQAQAAMQNGSSSGYNYQMPNGVGGIGGKIVSAAEQWLGTPYSWGGGGAKGPSKGIQQGRNTVGFDCSGLVQYAYAQVGLKMPRVSYGQLKMGSKAALNSLRPGDLVGFGNGHHIGIYIGGGKYIEAPHTGAQVRISSLKNRSDAWGVKVYH